MSELRLPAAIESLGPEAAERISTLVADAERRQLEEAERALQTALRSVPFPLRGVVRKVLTG